MSQNTSQPDESDVPFDWSLWELDEEEDMGMTPEHVRVAVEVMGALQGLAEERGWTDAFVCMDTFFAWVKSRPNVRVSPDVYVVWDALQPPPPSWQTWRPGHKPPDFALEICSADRRKEYDVNPAKYDSLGAGELVIYDPHGLGGRGPLSRYARDSNGIFVATDRDETIVYSKSLDVWLHATTGPLGVALRICRDPLGRSIVLTPADQRAARAIEEAARATENAARASAEAARASAEAARAKEEAARATEEAARAKEEAARTKEEAARTKEEAARASAEASRATEVAAGATATAAQSKDEAARAREEAVAEREQRAALEAEIAALRAQLAGR